MEPSDGLTSFQLIQYNDELLNDQLSSILAKLPNVFKGKALEVGPGFSTSYQRVLLRQFQLVEVIEMKPEAIKWIKSFDKQFFELYPESKKGFFLHAKPVQQWQPRIGDPKLDLVHMRYVINYLDNQDLLKFLKVLHKMLEISDDSDRVEKQLLHPAYIIVQDQFHDLSLIHI